MPPWLIPMGISLASGFIKNAMSNNDGRGGPQQRVHQHLASQRRTRPVYDQITRMGQQGGKLNRQYVNRLQSFDPMAAATQASQAQMTLAMPQIRQQLADLRGGQVGAGRLRTGYGQGDQDELLTTNLEHLNQSMIARAMEAARMQAAVNSELGEAGWRQQNLYYDAILGRERTEEEQRMADAASRRGMWGNLIGSGLQAAATYYGAKG